MKKNKNLLIVFAKPPIAGLAKTRLIPQLGAEGAAELHSQLVMHTLVNLINPAQWETQLWCSTEINHNFFQKCHKIYQVNRRLQIGNKLGDRMYHAMLTSLESYDNVCLIGTDCPVLDKPVIEQAFSRLKNVDMVFNPAEDGGYVLVSAKKLDEKIFQKVTWGTDAVMRQTKDNAKEKNFQLALLPTLWDVDVPEDLLKLASLVLRK